MGRPRRKHLDLPPGVHIVDRRYRWRPTSASERSRRRADGLPATIDLGPITDPAGMRRRWAELLGRRAPGGQIMPGTVSEILDRYELDELEAKHPDGRRKRSGRTVGDYRRALCVLRERFGAMRYARSEAEAALGGAIATHHVQRFLSEASAPIAANRQVAVLSDAFAAARRWGLTLYNVAIEPRR